MAKNVSSIAPLFFLSDKNAQRAQWGETIEEPKTSKLLVQVTLI